MTDILIAGFILLPVGLAAVYLIKEKRRGAGCIGCPAAGKCARGKCRHL